MRPALLIAILSLPAAADGPPLPKVAEGWKAELILQAPDVLFPTAIVSDPKGTLYVGQDPMDMPGPPTVPIDSILAIRPDGTRIVFADKLWAVMGLEYFRGTLYVVHAPFLSALKDTDGDGRADERIDLMTGLGPKMPGFNGINDHVPSGVRLGMDGYLYIAIGDKGIPEGVGKDGTKIQLRGGGVIRIKTDGTGLEVVSTGERNPLSVALNAANDVFTYGNDDDSKKWPNSLTHHIVGGHYGYPYEFLDRPDRCLPIVAGEIGGSGTQGVCYEEDGLPAEYRGDLFFCDWGTQRVDRFKLARSGATYKQVSRTPFIEKGDVADFRPFGMCVGADGTSFYVTDWAYAGWLVDGVKVGRIYKVSYVGADKPKSVAVGDGTTIAGLVKDLDHPARSVRMAATAELAARDFPGETGLAELDLPKRSTLGRMHAAWLLRRSDAQPVQEALRGLLVDPSADVRVQGWRAIGLKGDEDWRFLRDMLKDPNPVIRGEAAIALGRCRDTYNTLVLLYMSLGDLDAFVDWSIRSAILRRRDASPPSLLRSALRLGVGRRRDSSLRVADALTGVEIVRVLADAMKQAVEPTWKARLVDAIVEHDREYPPWKGDWFGTNPLVGRRPSKTVEADPRTREVVRAALSMALADAEPLVRRRAISGLRGVGVGAVEALRSRLKTEGDPGCRAALAEAVGALGDKASAPLLIALLADAAEPIEVRSAALAALAGLDVADSHAARLRVALDKATPASLVAEAVPGLVDGGHRDPMTVAGFLKHADPSVRIAALRTLGVLKAGAATARPDIRRCLVDADAEVRKVAASAAAQTLDREAIDPLIALARDTACRNEAVAALCDLPDPRALPVYLDAIAEKDPETRARGERALLAIRDLAAVELERRARAGKFNTSSAAAVERVLTRFKPIENWKVVGPFARTTAPLFLGGEPIDFDRDYPGAEGRAIRWQARRSDASGRVNIDDLKGGNGDKGGFGYDASGSPDLAAYAYADIPSDRDRDALMLVGSSGTFNLDLNGRPTWGKSFYSGRPFKPDSDRFRVSLKKGTNRVVMRVRQGIGLWSFGVQVAEDGETLFAVKAGATTLEDLRIYALSHDGDPSRGEAIFFDPRGIGCVKCHAAGGRGTANVGPDLTGLALKYDKAEIVRSVLEPSARLATGYQPVLVARVDGTVVAGLLKGETDAHLDLIDADARITRIDKKDVDERRVGDVSLMPVGLVDTLKVEEFADLIAYLTGLKAAGGARP